MRKLLKPIFGTRLLAAGLLSLVAALAVGLLVSARPAVGAFPGANGKIAFVSNRAGPADVWIMDADGSSPVNLTNAVPGGGAGASGGGFSGDGTKITFQGTKITDNGNVLGDPLGLFVMDADGSNKVQLTIHPWAGGEPAFSPDGTKIAFYSGFGGDNFDIYTMDADGSNVTRLTDDPGYDGSPYWSQDGTKISFHSQRDGNSEVYVMNADGTGETNLTNNPSYDASGDWSPDGTKMTFTTNRDGDYEIYVMNPDGTNQARITDNDVADVTAVWSPNGTKIAFVTDRDGDSEIYLMNADGSGQTNVSNSPGSSDGAPGWQPIPSDNTPPTISITTPTEGASYILGSVVAADYACDDEAGGSGVASCVGDVPDGTPLDTSSVGAKTFKVTASDNAGNQALQTHDYSVVYDFSGFFSPVDNPPVFNVAKAGSAIPVKFSLGGDQGLNVFATGFPVSQRIAGDGSATLDVIEETVTAGSSSLSYDATTGQYTYVWKTDKAWANTSRKLIVELSDGTSHVANFTFKK